MLAVDVLVVPSAPPDHSKCKVDRALPFNPAAVFYDASFLLCTGRLVIRRHRHCFEAGSAHSHPAEHSPRVAHPSDVQQPSAEERDARCAPTELAMNLGGVHRLVDLQEACRANDSGALALNLCST